MAPRTRYAAPPGPPASSRAGATAAGNVYNALDKKRTVTYRTSTLSRKIGRMPRGKTTCIYSETEMQSLR